MEIQAENKDGGQMQLESWTNWTQVQPTGRFTNGAEWRRSSLVWTLEPPLKGETSQTRFFLHTSKRAEKVVVELTHTQIKSIFIN